MVFGEFKKDRDILRRWERTTPARNRWNEHGMCHPAMANSRKIGFFDRQADDHSRSRWT